MSYLFWIVDINLELIGDGVLLGPLELKTTTHGVTPKN